MPSSSPYGRIARTGLDEVVTLLEIRVPGLSECVVNVFDTEIDFLVVDAEAA